MTTNIELDNLANKIGLNHYIPCRMKNELIGHKAKDNECGIVNLNDSTVSEKKNQDTGHWTAYFKKNGKSYYFCSYGSPPPIEVVNYLGKPILIHNFIIQQFGSSICGEICLLFLKLMSEGMKYTDAVLFLLDLRNNSC